MIKICDNDQAQLEELTIAAMHSLYSEIDIPILRQTIHDMIKHLVVLQQQQQQLSSIPNSNIPNPNIPNSNISNSNIPNSNNPNPNISNANILNSNFPSSNLPNSTTSMSNIDNRYFTSLNSTATTRRASSMGVAGKFTCYIICYMFVSNELFFFIFSRCSCFRKIGYSGCANSKHGILEEGGVVL